MPVSKRKRFTIHNRLAAYLTAGFVLVLMLVLLIFVWNYWQGMRQQMIYSLGQNYEQNAQGINGKMEQVRDLSTSMAVGYALNLFQVPRDAPRAEQLRAYDALSAYLDTCEFAMQDISIYYYPHQDSLVAHSQSRHYRPLESASWLAPALESKGRPVWVCMDDAGQTRLALARTLTDSKDFQQGIGVLVIAIAPGALANMMATLAPGQTILLAGVDGTLLAGVNHGVDMFGDPSLLTAITNGFQEHTLPDDRTMLLRCDALLDDQIRLISLVPYEYLGDSLRGLIVWISLSFLGAMMIIITYTHLTSKRLTSPLVKLTRSISDAAKGSIHRIEVETGEPEVEMLVTAYNTMADRIKELLEEQYRLGKERNRAELMALQSQINPHFLYNTLDMVNWMAERNDKENIQRVIQSMSKFYRLALSRGENSITIGEEIQLCETYLTLQQIRFHGRIHYEKDVDEAILSFMIPKITLQPFVENAIIHGLRDMHDTDGTISINGWMEDDRIVLAVFDDGAGMSEKDIRRGFEKDGRSHYGMKNIRTRLSIFYKEDIQLDLESTPGAGTCVSINIPAVMKEGDHA